MPEHEPRETGQPAASVTMRSVGPIAEGTFQIKPLTIFTGPNGAGKTITSTLLYILQKCLWNAFRSRLRHVTAQMLQVARSEQRSGSQAWHSEYLTKLIRGSRFQQDLTNSVDEELERAFALNRNIIRHKKKKAHFAVAHSLGWTFECDITANTVSSALQIEDIPVTFRQPEKDKPFGVSDIQAQVANQLHDAFGGWQDRPIMIPAGRAGITDSYRYLAEQVLLERHGYRRGGPSGITRDFLAILVGLSEPNFYLDDDEEMLELAARLFDPLLGGELRASPDPEELFTFNVDGYKIDRNVMSSMVKELGPMVVLLQQSQAKGSLLIVDEPECHLHPRAQIELAKAIVDLVGNDARFILSTHSPYLAQSLSNAWVEQSRDGKVPSSNMAVVNFSDSVRGAKVSDIPFNSEYGFTFEEFTESANVVQDRFVDLFN